MNAYDRTMRRLLVAYLATMALAGGAVLATLPVCLSLFGTGIVAAAAWIGCALVIACVAGRAMTWWVEQ